MKKSLTATAMLLSASLLTGMTILNAHATEATTTTTSTTTTATTGATTWDKDTEDFLNKAAISNLFEVESSRLALTRSSNAEVKAFAQRMIDDHTRASADMQAAVTAAGISPSVLPTSLDRKHLNEMDDLREEDAGDFDEEYMDEQETAHKKAVRLFENYAEDGKNAAIRDFATRTLPTLQGHHTSVKDLEDKVD